MKNNYLKYKNKRIVKKGKKMPFVVRQIEPIDLANKPAPFETDNPLERVTNSTLCQEKINCEYSLNGIVFSPCQYWRHCDDMEL